VQDHQTGEDFANDDDIFDPRDQHYSCAVDDQYSEMVALRGVRASPGVEDSPEEEVDRDHHDFEGVDHLEDF